MKKMKNTLQKNDFAEKNKNYVEQFKTNRR